MDDKKDKQLVIMSIIVAIFMWAFVQSTTNPSLTKTIRNVPLSIRNLENIQNKGYELVGKDQVEFVNVKVEASRSDMLSLDSEDLVASVDLQSPSEGIRSLNVDVDTPTGVKVIDIDPKKVNLKIEKVIEKKITPKFDITAKLKEGRIIEVNEMYPDEITVKGIRSSVEKISQIKATVDKEDYLNGKIHNIDLIALDKDGNKVDDISLSANQISLSFKVSETKEVPIKLMVKGDIDDEYEIKSAKIVPDKIILKADKAVLSKISQIETQTLDISKVKSNIDGKLDLVIPDNVEIYDGEKRVTYNITLKKKDKDVEE
ncbi:MAG: CdaR family protein [Peptoniphilaceae bacterium]|nr:CdaR family protein [Peptoniphilaceae bacterium]MDY6018227.1 CdaR family protein [Anaerococcus sp.]